MIFFYLLILSFYVLVLVFSIDSIFICSSLKYEDFDKIFGLDCGSI